LEKIDYMNSDATLYKEVFLNCRSRRSAISMQHTDVLYVFVNLLYTFCLVQFKD